MHGPDNCGSPLIHSFIQGGCLFTLLIISYTIYKSIKLVNSFLLILGQAVLVHSGYLIAQCEDIRVAGKVVILRNRFAGSVVSLALICWLNSH
jgi:hypothetical protein